ncbi:MAG: hypothetical protein HYV33_02590 [Candidatus Kerfeldbacteria bacterium]|nr:hypothetical protein [Candidatus Kerfeldbacteria bacterium]
MSFRPDHLPNPPQEHDPQARVERFIEQELRQQYQGTVVALNHAGLWEPLMSSPTELGITGMDGKEYPLPTPAGIAGTLALDTNQPLYNWKGWNNADRNGQAVYYPTQFDQTNHGGSTKAQLLAQLQRSPFPGYNLLLLPRQSAIPNQWKPGQRADLAPGQSGRDYLKTLTTTPDYAHEVGLTLEDWLTLALAHLETTNHVLDDYQGDGKAAWLLGSYHPSSGAVGYAGWNRGRRQVYLGRDDPDARASNTDVRPAVRMGRLEG